MKGKKIMLVVSIFIIIALILGALLIRYNITNFGLSGTTNLKASEYFSDYKKTEDLTDEDILDDYQKNYQENESDDGSYIVKSAEWTDKENGEALITIKANQIKELEDTTALYVATMCYNHGLTENILVRNILTLTQYYDKVDFIAINNSYEEGICDTKTFTSEDAEDEIRAYISETKAAGVTFAHATNSIPAAIQRYLFGGMGDSYIDETNLIKDPTAIYVSCDTAFTKTPDSDRTIDGTWGVEYATEKYFNFINQRYGDRYITMSQTSKTSDTPQLLVFYLYNINQNRYDADIVNCVLGVLNPEYYGDAELALSKETIEEWNNTITTAATTIFQFTDKKYAADYNYSQTLEEADVPIITNCTITDTVSDYFEIEDVNATGGSDDMVVATNGQTVTFYDENYICGDEVTITIKIKLKTDEVFNIEGFVDTNDRVANLIGENTLQVESPKLAPITSSYIVNYLDKDTNEKLATSKTVENVPINTIVEAEDEVIDIDGYYYDSADKTTLTITSTGENVINIYYKRIEAGTITVKYVDIDTDEEIAEREEIGGYVGDSYNTKQKEITGYDFVKVEGETEGILTEDEQTVIYYYKIKDPKIQDTIAKTSNTGKVTSVDQAIYYTIEYDVSITDYMGDGTITIIDYLPYEIDEEKSNLDGGKYSSENKTITWTEEITNIDTYTDGVYTKNITKEISLVFKDIDVTQDTIDNKVEGTLKLETPEKEETTENKEEVATDFYIDIPVEKVWDDSGNESHRPDEVQVILTANGEETDKSVVLNDSNDWNYTFKNLAKYTDEGKEIEYSITEKEVEENDLEYYEDPVITEENGIIVVTNKYKDLDTNVENNITKTGTTEITSSNDLVNYEISYDVEIDEYIGEAAITIIDYLPYEIDEDAEEIDLDGGTYNSEDKTITWEIDIGHINTDEDGKYENKVTKNISVVFVDLDSSAEKMTNKAVGEIALDAETYTDEETFDTNININGTVIAKYLEEGTNKVLADAVTQTGKVGTDYTTEQKEITGYDFVRVDSEEKANGTYTEGTIEVTYYYKLKDPIIDDEITKTSGTSYVTDKDQAIDYTIEYNVNITDYRGTATVTIVDELPYEIDEGKSDLDGGTYSSENKTITWTETIEDIDTYTNGAYTKNITKEISLVFKDIDVTLSTINNNVKGIIELETPEKEHTVEEDEELPVDFYIDIPVKKQWSDNENSKNHRPDEVQVTLTANGEDLEARTAILSSENEWSYIFENLPKYTDDGEEIEYSVVEKEAEENDLEYYDDAEIENLDGSIIVTNRYKDMSSNTESNIVKSGTEEITSSTQLVDYEINYEVEIEDYIGGGKITIIDYLPYEIDEDAEGIDLDGGTYDKDEKTITWEIDIGHINTDEDGRYENKVTKNISVVFVDLDSSSETMRNRVTGTIELDETDDMEVVEDTFDTNVNIEGTVIARYLEKDTNEVLADEVTQTGKVGEEYQTEQKDIEYYTFVEEEGGTEGKFEEQEKYVIYYYEKKPFNLEVDKNISKIVINEAEQQVTDEKLSKVEVPVASANSADLEVAYTIVISNTGEIEGTTDVIESIPDYFEVASGTNSEWEEQSDGTLKAQVSLQPGETKELLVVLKWIPGSSNFGTLDNAVSLENMNNPAGFDETTTEDNVSEASLIVSVKTGINNNFAIVILVLGVLIILAGIINTKRKR